MVELVILKLYPASDSSTKYGVNIAVTVTGGIKHMTMQLTRPPQEIMTINIIFKVFAGSLKYSFIFGAGASSNLKNCFWTELTSFSAEKLVT